jgi:hypothetical protein
MRLSKVVAGIDGECPLVFGGSIKEMEEAMNEKELLKQFANVLRMCRTMLWKFQEQVSCGCDCKPLRNCATCSMIEEVQETLRNVERKP